MAETGLTRPSGRRVSGPGGVGGPERLALALSTGVTGGPVRGCAQRRVLRHGSWLVRSGLALACAVGGAFRCLWLGVRYRADGRSAARGWLRRDREDGR